VPTVWDETKVLYAKIGEYGVIARRKGDEWFIGGINGADPRTLNIRFVFLIAGIKYSGKIYSDDPSVNTRTHVKIETLNIQKESVYPAIPDSNNGIAIHIVPVK
jgi:alpha-glucosidase